MAGARQGRLMALAEGDACMRCPKCGAEMPDGSRFCSSCGAPLAAAADGTAPSEAGPIVSGDDALRPPAGISAAEPDLFGGAGPAGRPTSVVKVVLAFLGAGLVAAFVIAALA